MMSTLVFRELLSRCKEYDIVFFDMGPSLGAINRSILLACDYFITPITPDIFNMLAMENIGKMLCDWQEKFEDGLIAVGKRTDKYSDVKFKLQYLGYVAQMFSTRGGKVKMAEAYEKVISRMPEAIKKNLSKLMDNSKNLEQFNLGSIKNFNSIIPISQMAHKPIIDLEYQDGVLGAHFNRLKEYQEILSVITKNIYDNVGGF